MGEEEMLGEGEREDRSWKIGEDVLWNSGRLKHYNTAALWNASPGKTGHPNQLSGARSADTTDAPQL